MKFLNERLLTEISAELVNAAADKQERLLNNTGYLKKISAWQYLRCIKRLDDFRKYAAAMADAINTGNTGSPEDPEVDVEVADETAEQIAASTSSSAAVNSVDAVSVEDRAEEVEDAPQVQKRERVKPIIPRIKFAGRIRPGKYVIKYISTMDDDVTSVWTEARSINGAINNIVNDLWDIKEIVSCEFADDAAGSSVADRNKIIDTNSHKTIVSLGNEIATEMTNGDFDNISELVDDKIADDVTVDCAKGLIYSGVDKYGNDWSGEKSSYRVALDSDKKKYTDPDEDYKVMIVTKINVNGTDDVMTPGRFNVGAFKRALHNGIVHFKYIKKTDGTERQAYGTTNDKILDANNVTTPAGGMGRGNREHLIAYYDLNSHGWRSCMITGVNLIYDESFSELKSKYKAQRKKKPTDK